jgi:signal-transduction protein with cAMP-binding, CBS, and nucleotidyltransferase domain
MRELIKRRLVFVDAEQTTTDVVATMRDQNISSILVLNRDRHVAGIVTERDIVQKFTLLEKHEKLHASVAAFMTRPVAFARLSHLEEDVRTMFFQKHLQHFQKDADRQEGRRSVPDISSRQGP